MAVKTLTQDQFEVKHAQEMELATRELERKSHDLVRVFNPLNYPFVFMQNRYWHRVPAKTEMDMERYLAMHFFKKICDFMIGQQIMVKGDALRKLREEQMGHEFMDHYEENVQIWEKVPRLNDADLIEQIKQLVIKGVVKEYGMDEPEVFEPQVEDRPTEYRSLHEQIFNSIDKKIVEGEINQTPLDTTTTLPVSIEEFLHPKGSTPGASIIPPAKESTEPPVYVSKKDKEKLEKEVTANG